MSADAGSNSPRFLIGIDLGTTNSALAYVDTADETWEVRDFSVPQLVAPATVEARDVLPSFHYEAAANEFPAGALRLPWSADHPAFAVGLFAREHGAAVPGRLAVSAKSWLSHSGVDRSAGLLPWHGAADVTRLSPVEVSARYLAHLRGAWDHAHPDAPLAAQQVILTVPASFDEVARELTVQAAQRAGFGKIVLVEEPQAAFYSWIDAQGAAWEKRVRSGQTVLVCDVGGGTSDFTLIRVRPAGKGKVLFHRVAVGEHLILGGDNLDLALAHFVEQRTGKLQPSQWGSLVRAARAAKETLLGVDPPAQTSISIAAGGSKLIGGSIRVELSRDEVEKLLLDGFLPPVPLDAKPIARQSGFQEFGLPYAADAAITRYLAAFLSRHELRPDLLLLNGGLFESPVLRQRLIDVLSTWYTEPDARKAWQAKTLKNARLDLAVARGAAYYGMVRQGRGVRISGGLAHSYYLGVESAGKTVAVCLLPAGMEEGQTISLTSRTFDLLIRQPAEFPLYFSATRTTDPPGEVIPLDPEQLTALPPIRTVLQSSRREGADTVRVHLHARLTEIGTLDIWCAEVGSDRRWRLQFGVRAAAQAGVEPEAADDASHQLLDEKIEIAGRERLQTVFRKGATEPPASIVKRLEAIAGLGRNDWPPSLLRAWWETLLELEPARRLSIEHESRWLSLLGFTLRPGYGLPADDWRVAQTWRIYASGVAFNKNELCRAEWWILWRRLAGGLPAGQQAMIGEPLAADWRNWMRKGGSNVRPRTPDFQFGPHESAEVWRLLGSLELLRQPLKIELGGMLLDRLPRERNVAGRDALLFALGRLGARVPVYGPLNTVVPVEVAEEWGERLMAINLPHDGPDTRRAFALVQLTRRTNDRYRDVSDGAREAAVQWLTSHNAEPHLIELVRAGGRLREEEQRSVFGETLPRGLRIE